MSDNVDHLSGGVRVGDLALLGHGPQLPEGGHQFLQSGVRHSGSVLLQHRQLGLRLWVVHSVAAENITCAQDKVRCVSHSLPPAGGTCSSFSGWSYWRYHAAGSGRRDVAAAPREIMYNFIIKKEM